METKECIAMILAGGRGERLGALTHYYSKPAVYFGGNYRIIDFSLNNCRNSGIDTVGILTQQHFTDLNTYINTIKDREPEQSGIHILTPEDGGDPYSGTADAVFKNTQFIDQITPEDVLILAGDHIYKMDYTEMLEFHRQSDADLTVASTPVSLSEASRFGIINAEENSGQIFGFEEKPQMPKSNLASMGIYIVKWSKLKKYLMADNENRQSRHDFGHNILPEMLSNGESLYTYRYNGYWRDVGTVESLWEANMDQINDPSLLQLDEDKWDIFSPSNNDMPDIISRKGAVRQSIMSGNCSVFGKVEHSVLSDSVTVGPGAEVVNSVVMPGAYIGDNVKIYNAVIGTKAIIMDNTTIGTEDGAEFFVDRHVCSKGISLVAPRIHIAANMRIRKNSQIDKKKLETFHYAKTNRTNNIHDWRPAYGG